MRGWLALAGVVSILAIDATAVTQTPRAVFEKVDRSMVVIRGRGQNVASSSN